MKYLLFLISIFIFTGCLDQLSTEFSLNLSEPLVQFDSFTTVNANNVTSFKISGSCNREGAVLEISNGIGEVVCSRGTFAKTVDMSTYQDGFHSLTVRMQDKFTSDWISSDAVLNKDTLAPDFSYSSKTIENDDISNYTLSGTCTDEGRQIEIVIGEIKKSTSCAGGNYSITLDLSQEVLLSTVSGSELITSDHPIDASALNTVRFRPNYSKIYNQLNVLISSTDEVGNKRTKSADIDFHKNRELQGTYKIKYGLTDNIDCSDTSDYETTDYNLNQQSTFDQSAYNFGEEVSVCALFIDQDGNEIVREESWMREDYPQVNNFECLRSGGNGNLAFGEVACYGNWDYGNYYGNDPDMCGGYTNPSTGCVISATQCASGQAEAVSAFDPREIETFGATLIEISQNLQSSPEVIQTGILHIWIYECL